MKLSSRTARRITAARRDAAKAHRKGLHTLASHARLAGVFDNDASGVGGALRAKAKTLGVEGVTAIMVRKTDSGVCYVRGARRYSKAQVAALAAAYNPRVAKYALAKKQLAEYAN